MFLNAKKGLLVKCKNQMTMKSTMLLFLCFAPLTFFAQVNSSEFKTQNLLIQSNLENVKSQVASDKQTENFIYYYNLARKNFNKRKFIAARENLQNAKDISFKSRIVNYSKNMRTMDLYIKKCNAITDKYFSIQYKMPLLYNYGNIGLSFAGLKYRKVSVYGSIGYNFPWMLSFGEKIKPDKLDYIVSNYIEIDKVYGNYTRVKKREAGFAYATIGITKSIIYPLWFNLGVGYLYGNEFFKIETGDYDNDGISTQLEPVYPQKGLISYHQIENKVFHGPLLEGGLTLLLFRHLTLSGSALFMYDLKEKKVRTPIPSVCIGFAF